MDQERSFERPQPTGLPALLGGTKKMGVNVRPSRLGLRVPALQIIHKVETNEQIERGERPGYFKYGQKILPGVSVVFLKADEVRRYDYKAHENDKPTTLCASADGIEPLAEISEPPSSKCEQCKFGSWKDDPTRVDEKTGKPKRIPPVCTPGIAFLGMIPDENLAPFWLVCAKTAEPAARKFLREFYEDPAAVYLHEWKVRLGTEQASSDSRSGRGLVWYTPTFTLERTQGADVYLGAFNAVAEAGIRFVPFLGRNVTEEPPEMQAPMPTDEDVPHAPTEDDDIPF